MIERIKTYITDNTIPYENLAVEEWLLRTVEPNECILFLWQNMRTVVVGKNQNVRSEVRIDTLEEEGGYLVRRLSGGGAVYHDLGNLNFTFLIKKKDYDLDKQSSVILEMAKMFGLDAIKTGRNDILINGSKFSGNAYYSSGENSYHHGTIMVDVDKDALGKYLNVSAEKLKSKGVSSVKSRVTNLSELDETIDIQRTLDYMIKAFEKIYKQKAQEMRRDDLDWGEIKELENKFASPEWKYGRKLPFSFSIRDRYKWGGIEVFLDIQSGEIQDLEIYSDAMDVDFIGVVTESLRGAEFAKEAIRGVLLGMPEKEIAEDIMKLFSGCF